MECRSSWSDAPILKSQTRKICVVGRIEGDKNELMGVSNCSDLAIGEGWCTTERTQASPLATVPAGSRLMVGQHGHGWGDHLGKVVLDSIAPARWG